MNTPHAPTFVRSVRQILQETLDSVELADGSGHTRRASAHEFTKIASLQRGVDTWFLMEHVSGNLVMVNLAGELVVPRDPEMPFLAGIFPA